MNKPIRMPLHCSVLEETFGYWVSHLKCGGQGNWCFSVHNLKPDDRFIPIIIKPRLCIRIGVAGPGQSMGTTVPRIYQPV